MIELAVHDKADTFKMAAVPAESHIELLWNQVSFAEVTFDDDHPVWEHMVVGARVRVMVDEVEQLRGPVRRLSGSGPDGRITATVEDDFRKFRLLGWPKPAAAINLQTDEFKRYSGVTETVVKAACADLSTRLGLGWSIPTTTGLGTSQRVEFRFDPLVDLLLPPLTVDRLTWTIRGNVVDVTAGETFPRVLTPESGVLGDYSWEQTGPDATRVVVGGEGEGSARVLRSYTDSARETAYGEIVEVFKDSRMADGVTDFTPDSAEVFAELAPRVSVTADLQESSWFRFGLYKVGDLVDLKIGPIEATEVIRSVVIDDTPGDGTVTVPSIGELANTADALLGRQVARHARGLRAQERR